MWYSTLFRDFTRMEKTMFSRGQKSGGRSPGFTLIELLVVMGIIGMLMALLFPAINLARAMAHKTDQMEFVKNLEAACKLYQEDFQNARQYPWMPYYDQVNGLLMYDPDIAMNYAGKSSEDVIRTLAPDNQVLFYGGCYMPKNATNYITIPMRFVKIPAIGEHCTQMTAVDLWTHEYRFMNDPVTLDPVVYSKGKLNKDSTKAHFQWQADLNGNHRAEKEEMVIQSNDFGGNIPLGIFKTTDVQ
jgi:prepilin-type N-terminal cleavage/methylation domain-containing protein